MVPVLNGEATLGACLDAILGADAEDTRREILVIDNGSTDRTLAIAEHRGVGVVRAKGVTIAALRNLGVRLAQGTIIAYVDSDCVIAPNWLRLGLAHFADPTVGAVGAPTEIPNGSTWVQRIWRLHRHRSRSLRVVDWLPTENLMIRKSAFEAMGGFNEALVTCEDVDFCYRLGRHYRILSNPALLSIHLGEAPTLARLFRKEAWRGRGNLAGFRSHGFRLSELPSVLLPLYHLGFALGLVAALGYWVLTDRALPAIIAAAMLALPAALGASIVAVQTGQLRSWPALALVYLTYALARATAVVADLRTAHEARPTGARPKHGMETTGR